jgi:hypothetical protein
MGVICECDTGAVNQFVEAPFMAYHWIISQLLDETVTIVVLRLLFAFCSALAGMPRDRRFGLTLTAWTLNSNIIHVLDVIEVVEDFEHEDLCA